MHSVGIIQPNFIPWRGYFDFIKEVDTFVFLDDVQYTPRDWRNRNRIKVMNGQTKWLSVPVVGGRHQLIKNVAIDSEQRWERKHLEALRHSYGKTPYFDRYFPKLQELFGPERSGMLCDFDIQLTERIASWLGLSTRFVVSSNYDVPGAKDDKLLGLVQALGGSAYLSGPSARDYIRPQLWADAGVELHFKDYEGYPEYEQISEPFEPSVSVLDLLFMKGDESPEYIWGEHRARRGESG